MIQLLMFFRLLCSAPAFLDCYSLLNCVVTVHNSRFVMSVSTLMRLCILPVHLCRAPLTAYLRLYYCGPEVSGQIQKPQHKYKSHNTNTKAQRKSRNLQQKKQCLLNETTGRETLLAISRQILPV
ncbi:hypothetical protein ATANTOWER_009571 [Ataeniobius toweri]|uniref:Secreted protein n=1 Tax=Ataeniobius toweri TaxID=208326 RepID=A0ABU7BPA1_9TELE|nr:hypothetical protein [Ataeniobius toweri]